MTRLKIDVEAAEEVAAAAAWYEQRAPLLRKQFLGAIRQAFSRIEDVPHGWRRARNAPAHLEIRECLLRRFPYAIVYLVLPIESRVLAVAHTRRRPGYWRKRL